MMLLSDPQTKFLKPVARILLSLVIFYVYSCDSTESTNSKVPRPGAQSKTSYAIAQKVEISVPVENPIDHALSLVDLERADLRRPLSHEEGYNLIGRNPLIDRIAQSPFYLHHWADTNSKLLQENAQNGIQNVFAYLVETLNGGVSYGAGRDASANALSVADAYAYLCRQ